ncbi:MAG: TraB/GumN family protein [Spirochaetes bacterium]|nr:TraB/GumN family protein [Spirochaetota bacterium]
MNVSLLRPSVHRIELDDGRVVVLVGTAHVGEGSIAEVARTLAELAPDTVCVELDEDRLRTLENPKPFEDLDIVKILRGGKTFLFAGHLLLAGYQKKLAQETGTKPGDEMRKAVSLAREKGANLAVVDRHVQTTLRRLWVLAGFKGQVKLLWALIGGFGEEAKEADIEKLKERDALDAMLEEMGAQLPEAKRVLIDERDEYLAGRIHEKAGKVTVAVLGAGHLPGVLKHLATPAGSARFSELDTIPKTFPIWTVLAWSVPIAIGAVFAYAILTGRGHITVGNVGFWLACKMAGAALGATIALAHPLTILVAMAAAPVGLFVRGGVALFSSLTEAWIRKPKVSDFTALSDDASSVKGWYRNRITRVLLVWILASLGSAAGNLAILPVLVKVFKPQSKAPIVSIVSGPKESLATNAVFALRLGVDRDRGYFRTNGSPWTGFDAQGASVEVSGDTTLEFFGSNSDGAGPTNRRIFILRQGPKPGLPNQTRPSP